MKKHNKYIQNRRGLKRVFVLLTSLIMVIVATIIPIYTANAKVIPGGQMDIFTKGIRRLDVDSTTSSGGSQSGNCVVDGTNVTWIGDSISVQSSSVIQNKLPGVDIHAMNSKKFSGDITENNNKSGLTIMRELGDSLRNYVVIALGTNPINPYNGVQQSYIDDALTIIGENRKLVLVTNYEVGTTNYENNNTLIKNAASDPRVSVADWETVALNNMSSDGTNSYRSDGVHLSGIGIPVFVDTIYNALGGSSSGAGGGINTNVDIGLSGEALARADQVATRLANMTWGKLNGGKLNAVQLAALMGNFKTESGFNPNASNTAGDGHKGLAQWRRYTRYWANQSNYAYDATEQNLDHQTDYVHTELEGSYGEAVGRFWQISSYDDLKEATWLIVRNYEIAILNGGGPSVWSELSSHDDATIKQYLQWVGQYENAIRMYERYKGIAGGVSC